MVQRIQTLFLLAASGLLFSLFFNNFTSNTEMTVKYTEYTPFLVFTIVTFALSFITLFLWKNRMLQMRICVYNMLILLGYQGWIVYLFFQRPENTAFSITAVFPVVAGILVFLAFRFIGRDEAIVQSMNSLRKIHKNRKRG